MKKRKNNNGIFYIVISLVAILGIGSGLYAYSVSNNVNVDGDYNYYEAEGQEDGEINLGAFPGPDVYANMNIHGSLVTGSSMGYNTTTRDATHTFTFKDLNNYTYWDILNEEAADSHLTFTMPATATMMQILPKVGSRRTWLLHNATTTENTLTIAEGAGMDIVGIDTNVDAIAANGWAELTCTQIVYRNDTNQNILCEIEEHLDAD